MNQETKTFRISTRELLMGIFFLSPLWIALYFSLSTTEFSVDDAYIHLVYAQNIGLGKGFCFNEGEPSIGTSSPMWVFLLVIPVLLHINLYIAARLFAITCTVLLGIFSYLILQKLLDSEGKNPPEIVYQALVLLFFNGNLAWLMMSGMETMFFLCLGLGLIVIYSKHGFGIGTGILGAIMFLTRVEGLFLLIPMVIAELLKTKKPSARFIIGIILMGLIISGWFTYHYYLTGHLFPTTSIGKRLTYVDGYVSFTKWVYYIKPLFQYFGYLPQYGILIIFLISFIPVVIYLFIEYRSKYIALFKLGQLYWIILAWLFMHLGAFALMFRSLNQQLRYCALIFPNLLFLSIPLMYRLELLKPWLKKPIQVFLTILMLIGVVNLPSWKSFYLSNCEHMGKVYRRMAVYMKENLPVNARVAAFDIGMIKWVSQRYIIDTAGLIDPSSHKELKNKKMAKYIREKKATHILYSRTPDCDLFNGFQWAEHGYPDVLSQTFLKSFSIKHYEIPTITNSFKLDLYKINGWFSRLSMEDKRKIFVDPNPKINIRRNIDFGGYLNLVGFYVQDKTMQQLPSGVIEGSRFTFYWRKIKTYPGKLSAVLRFINVYNNKIMREHQHVVTHNALPMRFWKNDDLIKETFYIILPYEAPVLYHIRLTVIDSDTKKILSPKSVDYEPLGAFVGSIKILPSAPYRINRLPRLGSMKTK